MLLHHRQARDMKHRVSVVIPVHNGERYLAEAIDSVLAQGEYLLDVVVVDDGSTDDSAQIAKSRAPEIGYHYQAQSGAAVARNTGVELTQGDFIAFLDADDTWEANKLALQLQAFSERPQLDMVFALAQQFISPELDADARSSLVCPDEPEPGYLPSAMLVRRQSFLRAGLFSGEHQIGEFIDWFARATDAGLSGLMLPRVLLHRRIHEANQGVSKRNSYNAAYLRILKQSLDRRRAKAKDDK